VKDIIPLARDCNPNTRVNGNNIREEEVKRLISSPYFNSHLSSSMLQVFLSLYILSM